MKYSLIIFAFVALAQSASAQAKFSNWSNYLPAGVSLGMSLADFLAVEPDAVSANALFGDIVAVDGKVDLLSTPPAGQPILKTTQYLFRGGELKGVLWIEIIEDADQLSDEVKGELFSDFVISSTTTRRVMVEEDIIVERPLIKLTKAVGALEAYTVETPKVLIAFVMKAGGVGLDDILESYPE